MIMQIGPIDKSNLATTDDEFKALVESDVDWIARSADDVRELREAQYGPFGKLPEDDFQEFVDSLKFNGGGVATGSYRPLMSSLTLTELFEVFECFGMSQELSLEAKEQICVNHGTENAECVSRVFHFCVVSCQPI
jgi:hypothetical protein